MITQLQKDFKRFLETQGYCTPPGRATCALNSARTLAQWREAEAADCVRLKLIPEEENYFDVYGQPETQKEKDMIVASIERQGLWLVVAEVNTGDEQTGSKWEHKYEPRKTRPQ